MEEIKNKIIKTYKYGDYIVEIEDEGDGCLGSWLYREDAGFKMYMFGAEETMGHYLVLVKNNIESYLDTYRTGFGDGEDYDDCP